MKLISLFFLFFFANCLPFIKTNGPTYGFVFTSTNFPGEFNQSNMVKPPLAAQGCNLEILNIVMWGDSGAGSIAMKNGIKKIATIDHSYMSVLGIFNQYCTLIKGE